MLVCRLTYFEYGYSHRTDKTYSVKGEIRKSCKIFIENALGSGRWGKPRYRRMVLKRKSFVRNVVD